MNMFEAHVVAPDRVRVGALDARLRRTGATRSRASASRLGLRPEEVRIRGVDAGAPNTHCRSRSSLLDFLGAFWRATLRPSSCQRLVAALRFLRQRHARPRHPRRPDADGRACRPELLRVFDGGAEPGA